MRQFSSSEQAYDRAIDLAPDLPILKVLKATNAAMKSGDDTSFRAALAALPASRNAKQLGNLAVVDALLGKKEDAIAEAKRAVEMLPISEDVLDGPIVLVDLAQVYAWTDQLDLAFEQAEIAAKIPNGVYYGDLKLGPYWDPLRKDPRFDKLLAELAPKD